MAVVEMIRDAKFSECGKYRYWLTRVWNPYRPILASIGLNPSIADKVINDRTISKEIRYATGWGYGGLLKLNLFGLITPYPKVLWETRASGKDIIGPGNSASYLAGYLEEFGIEKVLATWGRCKTDRGRMVVALLNRKIDCLKKNDDGSPAHPLYLKGDLKPIPWNY